MRPVFLLLIIVLFFSFCERKSTEHFLHNGLEGYRKVRMINKSFIKDYKINKIGFFRLDSGNVQIVVKLDDEIKEEKINQYSIGIYAYIDNKYISHNKDELDWDTHPKLHGYGNNKYFIDTIKFRSKKMDSLVFYLFDRDRYRKMIGHRVILKNIGI